MRTHLPLVVIVAALLALGADTAKSDKELLAGDWEIVSFERAGKQEQDSIGDLCRFAGDKLSMIDKDDPCETCVFDVALDAEKDPKQIDLSGKSDEADAETETLPGIYRLKEGRLVICIRDPGNDRPSEFKATDDETCVIELKRVK